MDTRKTPSTSSLSDSEAVARRRADKQVRRLSPSPPTPSPVITIHDGSDLDTVSVDLNLSPAGKSPTLVRNERASTTNTSQASKLNTVISSENSSDNHTHSGNSNSGNNHNHSYDGETNDANRSSQSQNGIISSNNPFPPRPSIASASRKVDPLIHLSRIFEQIGKQVLEWGEDANWKIDVFLLPSDNPAEPPPGPNPAPSAKLPSAPPGSIPPPNGPPSSSKAPPIHDHSRIHQETPLWSRPHDIDFRRDGSSRHEGPPPFELEPPPKDLTRTSADVSMLDDADIFRMDEPALKRTLSLAVRRIQEQHHTISQLSMDMKRSTNLYKQLELSAEGLHEDRRRIEQDNLTLSAKNRELRTQLTVKDFEINELEIQLSTKGINPPTQHRPRAHHHHHHHRHRVYRPSNDYYPRGSIGMESLENLALLATQVLSKEKLKLGEGGSRSRKRSISSIYQQGSGVEYEGSSKLNRDETEHLRTPNAVSEDRGLILRPVKRLEKNGQNGKAGSSDAVIDDEEKEEVMVAKKKKSVAVQGVTTATKGAKGSPAVQAKSHSSPSKSAASTSVSKPGRSSTASTKVATSAASKKKK